MLTAKIIDDNDSQIICFPPDFRIQGNEVIIRQCGTAIILLPVAVAWKTMFDSLNEFSSDFCLDRVQPAPQDRSDWFNFDD